MIVEANAGYRMEEDGSGRVLVQFGDRIKVFHIYVFFARKGFAEQSPEAIRAFLAGWFETIDHMRSHSDRDDRNRAAYRRGVGTASPRAATTS